MHSVVRAQGKLATVQAQCGASDSGTRPPLRRGPATKRCRAFFDSRVFRQGKNGEGKSIEQAQARLREIEREDPVLSEEALEKVREWEAIAGTIARLSGEEARTRDHNIVRRECAE